MGSDSAFGEPFYEGYSWLEEMKERSFPEDYHLSNGNYICKCRTCGEFFMGYKRRIMCKLCEDTNQLP